MTTINDQFLKNTIHTPSKILPSNRINDLSRTSLTVDKDGLLSLGHNKLDSTRKQQLLEFALVARHSADEISSSSLLVGHNSETDDFGDVPFTITVDRDEDIAHRSPNDIARLILNQLQLNYTLIVEDDAIAQRLPKSSETILNDSQKKAIIEKCSAVGQPTLDFSASISNSENISIWAIRIAERQYLGLLTISVNS
ncbi:hypothetical protein E3Q17_03978 [Wallemia mellicola]|uniref:Uncharacterized protein n=1 Tax=Wallemia mellicola TaxID=1708541 RepID=A0A4V4ML84_9BASI|nr:hypothetical protein E3Q17_03978 [Wallemia mellicola]